MKNQRKQSVIITKLHNVSSSVKCMWWYTTCRVFMTVTWDNICLFSHRLKFGIYSSLEVVANLVFIFILWSWQLWNKLPYESRSTRKLAPVSISNSSNSLLDHHGQEKRYSNLSISWSPMWRSVFPFLNLQETVSTRDAMIIHLRLHSDHL